MPRQLGLREPPREQEREGGDRRRCQEHRVQCARVCLDEGVVHRAGEASLASRARRRLQAALDVRRRQPDIGVLILSQYYDEAYAGELVAEGADGVGYLLKERVGDVDRFVQAATRVATGRGALDPEVVARMVGRRRRDSPIAHLSPRELEVLGAIAEGKSNRGIAEPLVVSQAAVEKHVTSIFHKLGLDPAETEHRRVLAVLAYL